MRRTLKHTLVSGARLSRSFSQLTSHLTTLSNGLRVAVEPSNVGSETGVVVYVDAGSRFETEETNGVANFLHRCIISSNNNNNNIIDGRTYKEHTAYYSHGSDYNIISKALDTLSDVLQNSTFEETIINQERDFILRHMEEQKGIEQIMLDHLHAAAFQGGPLGRTILGPAENIKKITKKDIQDYFSTHYAPHRMVISAYGPAVKNADVVDQVKKLFTKLPANPVTTKQLLEKQPAIFTGSEIRVRDDDFSLARFAVAFKGASWTDPDYVVLMLLQAMLGSWNKTAEHNIGTLVRIGEVAESMTAFNTNYKDTGLFGVHAVAKPDCLEDMAYAIMKEICNGLCCRVSEDDVIRAQNQLKSSLLNTHGTSAAEEIGRQVITHWRRIPNAELLSRIDAVDVATVKRVAYRFLFDQDIAIVASGPIKRLPDYSRLRSRTYMLRY